MIRRILFLAFISLFIFACDNESEEDGTVQNDTINVVSDEIALIPLADFEKMAGDFVGKEIQINGIADHVCKHGGKKILLVNGDNSLHVFSDERFDEEISGSEISLTGIVEEEKIDEVYLNEWWEHAQESHGGGTDADKEYLANLKNEIQQIRDSLKNEGVEYFPEYSLKYVSHTEKK